MSLSRFEQTLLASGVNDGPSPERRRAARAAVLRAAGVGAGASALSTASTADAASPLATTSAGVASTGAAKPLTLAKIVFLAALGLGGVGAAVLSSKPLPSTVQLPTSASAAPPSTSVARAAASPDREEAPPSSEARTAVSAPEIHANPVALRPAKSASKAVTIPPAEDPLVIEARILESARACLAAGDRSCARARLAEHRARFARGALVDEAAVLAIDLALADGDRSEARRLARALVDRTPRGAWSSRVRRLAEENDE